jgi:hypothetical protein
MQQSNVNVDRAALVALAAIIVGWFLMATLVVDFGLWQQSIRFYDVWSVIQDPAARLSGVGRAHALTTLGFALLCAAAVAAPAISVVRGRKELRLSYYIPFLVMAISGAVLYAKSSTTYIHADANAHSASALFARMAQVAVTRVGDTLAARLSIGLGAYVALFGSCVLAVRGWMSLRNAAIRPVADAGGAADLAARRQRDAGARQIEP